MGGGRVGSRVARLLIQEKHDIALIEKDPSLAEKLSGQLDGLIVNGDGTNRRILLEAGIEKADFFISATSADKDNMLASEIAKRYNVKKIISRVTDPDNHELFIDLGIVAVNETSTTVSAIRNATISGERLHRMTQICDDRAEIVRTVITITSKVIGKKVKDLNLNKKIFCIDRESEVVLPDDKTTFKEGDVVYAVVLPEESDKLVSLLHGEDS